MVACTRPLSFCIFAVAATVACGAVAHDPDQEESPQVVTAGLHEMAKRIRRYESWRILGAQPRKRASGYWYFRFKMLRDDGTIKVIYIDPRNPDFKRLEQ